MFSGSKISILLVDDDSECLNIVEEILTLEGHQILATSNGLEALDILESNHFQLSILDVHMPIIDGFEIFRRLTEVETIPCIFMTGDHSKELKLQAMDMGAFSVLYKPLNKNLLKYTVQKVLEDVQ